MSWHPLLPPNGIISHCFWVGACSPVNHRMPLQVPERGMGGQMEESMHSPLLPLAGCHHPDTLLSLLRECHHPACMTGWPSSEPSPARCNTAPCCHGYSAISPELWHQCLRGARVLPHAYTCAWQGTCHIWASYNIFSRKWKEKEGKVTQRMRVKITGGHSKWMDEGTCWPDWARKWRVNTALGFQL